MTFKRTAFGAAGLLAALLVYAAPPAHAVVVINEFMAVNVTSTQTAAGNYADWIELYNKDFFSKALLGGFYLSDNPSTPTKWRIPDYTEIPGGGYLLIWCDDTTAPLPQDPLHTSFRLDGTFGEVISLYWPDAVTTYGEAVRFGHQAADVSYGRYGDGNAMWVPFAQPTPGRRNASSGVNWPASLRGILFVNEWLASNIGSNMRDNSGQRDDWFELYNAGDVPIDLGGYYVTDHMTTPTTFRIPYSNVIGPRGHALFWADKDEEQGLTHCSFNLSGNGEDLAIYEKNGVTLIDSITFAAQTTNISQGRRPDGAPNLSFFSHPTMDGPNFVPSTRIRRWTLFR